MSTATASDRAIPHNLEAERALLGSILLDNATLPVALKIIGRLDMFSEAHRIILGKMQELAEKRRAIDLVTLSEALDHDHNLEKAGGAAYISALPDGAPIGSNGAVPEYCRIIKAKATARRLIVNAQNLIARAIEDSDNPETLIGLAQSQVADVQTEFAPDKANVLPKTGSVEVQDPTQKAKDKKRKAEDRTYPLLSEAAWHPAARLYLQAHENMSEGSNNWHFLSFYTAMGALLGRTVGTRMGGMIYPNLYTVLVGVLGGDGKDTVADAAMEFAQAVDPLLFVPEGIDSKPGFCVDWQAYNQEHSIVDNCRCVLRLPEISTLLSVAAQKGTQSVVPMLLTHYGPRDFLANATSSMTSRAKITRPHISVLACGAKKYIGEIPEKDLISGLGRRVCFGGGDAKGPNADPPPPDSQIINPLIKTVREIVDFWKQRQDHSLALSPESKKLWKSWYEKVYWRRKKGDEIIPAMNNGDRVTCRKIALINAAMDRADQFIEPQHLEPALAAGEYLFECRYPIFAEHGANPNLEIEKKIMARIPEHPARITKRVLQQACHLDAQTFNMRLDYLCAEGGEITRRRIGQCVWVWKNEDL